MSLGLKHSHSLASRSQFVVGKNDADTQKQRQKTSPSDVPVPVSRDLCIPFNKAFILPCVT